jgi:hypothetical protein
MLKASLYAMAPRQYWSQRQGRGALPFDALRKLLARVIDKAYRDDLFAEAFGQECPDAYEGWIEGRKGSIVDRILVDLHREDLWPPSKYANTYDLDGLYDLIEFLYDHASAPMDGDEHPYYGHTHWTGFDAEAGQDFFRSDVNRVLLRADPPVELHENGRIGLVAAEGFEQLLDAELPDGTPKDVAERVQAAIEAYKSSRSQGDLRNAVRDLGDALEALRKDAKILLNTKDERDLFAILNTFAIRHLNEKQRSDYDAPPYLRWMFYVFLATVHLILRLRDQA